MIIIGAGVIGLELGSVWGRLGTSVTVVEFLPGLISNVDRQMGSLLERSLTSQGMEFLFEHKVKGATTTKNGVKVLIEDSKGESKDLEADVVLVAVGRRPFLEGVGLEEGVENPLQSEMRLMDLCSHTKRKKKGSLLQNFLPVNPVMSITTQSYVIYTWPEMAWEERAKKN